MLRRATPALRMMKADAHKRSQSDHVLVCRKSNSVCTALRFGPKKERYSFEQRSSDNASFSSQILV
jgi:hypothetical protein